VHFLVEAEVGLSGGAFGRVAAGWNNIFWPTDSVARKRQARREAKHQPTKAEHADMDLSEKLPPSASRCGSCGQGGVPNSPSGSPHWSRASSNPRLSSASCSVWTSSPLAGTRYP